VVRIPLHVRAEQFIHHALRIDQETMATIYNIT
jgi:hypothetical protein